ncbi:hypothetical protein ACQKWADRAFT_314976 [Trichoderma austrokoningii]
MKTFCLLLSGKRRNGNVDVERLMKLSCPVSLVDSLGEGGINVEVVVVVVIVVVVTAVFLSKAWAARALPSIRPSSIPLPSSALQPNPRWDSATNKHLPLHGPTDVVIIVLLPAG